MSFKTHFEDADLALYALHLLEEPLASAVARAIVENRDTRERFEAIRTRLGLYAALQVKFKETPEGSLQRLMHSMHKEPERQHNRDAPTRMLVAPAARRLTVIFPWVGWVLAAGLLVAVTLQRREDILQRKALSENTLARNAQTFATSGEKNSLRAQLLRQADQIRLLQSGFCGSGASPDLRKTTQSQATELASTRRERNELRETINTQAVQAAQLEANAESGRKLLAALGDPQALRILLAKPHSKSAPTARVIYLSDQATLVFLASNLNPLKANRVYQLWLLPKDGKEPVPSGTFVPDANGNASIVSTQFGNAIQAKGFAVTIEASANPKTPTLPIVLANL